MATGNCGHCGKEFEGRGTYCSVACKQAAYRARHGAGTVTPSERAAKAAITRGTKAVALKCAHCGNQFAANGNQAAQGVKYCSDACKQAAYRARRADSALATLAPYMMDTNIDSNPFEHAARIAPKVARLYSQGHWALKHDDYRIVTAEELADLVIASPGGWVIEKHD